jgi:hypothetical protein
VVASLSAPMGVRVLARTTTEPLATLEARLNALGARHGGRWRTACNYLLPRAADSGLHELFEVTSSEEGGDRHLVARARGGGVRVLRAGASIGAVLEATHTHVARVKVAIEGAVHLCGDFVVRMGQCFHNGSLAGVALDVEYLPCPLASSAATAQPLHAFVDRLLPAAERDYSSAQAECFSGVNARSLPDAFGPEHAALLLVGLMRARLLASVAPSAAS